MTLKGQSRSCKHFVELTWRGSAFFPVCCTNSGMKQLIANLFFLLTDDVVM